MSDGIDETAFTEIPDEYQGVPAAWKENMGEFWTPHESPHWSTVTCQSVQAFLLQCVPNFNAAVKCMMNYWHFIEIKFEESLQIESNFYFMNF